MKNYFRILKNQSIVSRASCSAAMFHIAFYLVLFIFAAQSVSAHEHLPRPITFGAYGPNNSSNWYFEGEVRPAIFIDTVHNDPTIRAARTEVFGDNGLNSPRLGSDTSRIPNSLDETGSVGSSRPLALDAPEFGGSVLGTRFAFGTRGPHHNVFLELGWTDPNNQFVPELYRAGARYRIVSLEYGYSSFMDFYKDDRQGRSGGYQPRTLDYFGPLSTAYKRDIAFRLALGAGFYFGIERASYDVYRGFARVNTANNDLVYNDQIEPLQGAGGAGDIRIYEITRQLRTRNAIPDFIFTYYGNIAGRTNVFASLLFNYVYLDRNSPLLLESDPGLLQLTRDAERNARSQITDVLDRELRFNNEIRGKGSFNVAFNFGVAGPIGRGYSYTLGYIYNGGRYLRDNPNPSHLLITTRLGCTSDCSYRLVNVDNHSYLAGIRLFQERLGFIFSGTITPDTYGIQLGGGATRQIHNLYVNYFHPIRRVPGLTNEFEFAYAYRQTFNTRNNLRFPRLRFGYGLTYKF